MLNLGSTLHQKNAVTFKSISLTRLRGVTNYLRLAAFASFLLAAS